MLQESVRKENKAFSPKMVRDLLKIDNEKIISLCKKVSLVPKKNSKGQTYFSRDDVKILKRVQDLQAKAMQKQSSMQTNPVKTSQVPANLPAKVQTVIDAKLAERAVDTIERLNQTLGILETNLTNSISNNITTKLNTILDEKLDGMDEVVVELIRTKTENENLRHKLNDLNKENFYLKNNLNSYKPIGFGFYTKKSFEIDEI